jgi:Ca2+/Na+ antiporter
MWHCVAMSIFIRRQWWQRKVESGEMTRQSSIFSAVLLFVSSFLLAVNKGYYTEATWLAIPATAFLIYGFLWAKRAGATERKTAEELSLSDLESPEAVPSFFKNFMRPLTPPDGWTLLLLLLSLFMTILLAVNFNFNPAHGRPITRLFGFVFLILHFARVILFVNK